MADSIFDDNVQINLGTGGAIIATDYVVIDGATAHVQYVKIAQGGTASFEPISDDTPLSVVLRNSSGTELAGVGDSIPVDIVSSGITLDFSFDNTEYWKVAGSTDGSVPVVVAGTSAGAPVPVKFGTGDNNVFIVAGTAGGEAVGITATNFDIRGLTLEYSVTNFSGGVFGVTGDVVGAYLVRGLSAGSSASGATAYDSVSVQGIENGRPVTVSQNLLGSSLTPGFTGAYAGTHDIVGVQGVSGGYPIPSVLAFNNTNQLPTGFTAVGFSGSALLVSLQESGISAEVNIPSALEVFGFTGQAGLSGMPSLVYGKSGSTWTGIGNSGDNLKVWLGNELTATFSDSNIIVTGTGPVGEVIVGGTAGTYPVGIRVDGWSAGVTANVNLPANAATETTLSAFRTNIQNALPSIDPNTKSTTVPSKADVQQLTTVLSQLLPRTLASTDTDSVTVYVMGATAASTFTSGSSTTSAANSSVLLPSRAVTGVKLKAHPSNTELVWVSHNSDENPTTSYPLNASEEVFLEIGNLNTIRFWSPITGQTLSWIGS